LRVRLCSLNSHRFFQGGNGGLRISGISSIFFVFSVFCGLLQDFQQISGFLLYFWDFYGISGIFIVFLGFLWDFWDFYGIFEQSSYSGKLHIPESLAPPN
jgi:hypothetical protein